MNCGGDNCGRESVQQMCGMIIIQQKACVAGRMGQYALHNGQNMIGGGAEHTLFVNSQIFVIVSG